MMAPALRLLTLLLVILGAGIVQADFGDYADTSFDCPAITTCPTVCTEAAADCPTNCAEGKELCADGSCKTQCDGTEYNKCAALFACTTFSCAKINTDFDTCEEDYRSYYDKASECAWSIKEHHEVSFWEPAFVFCYVWIIFVTVLVVWWGVYNQRLVKVPNSTLQLEESNATSHSGWTQTAYKYSRAGRFIYFTTMKTWWSIQFLLAMLTVLYYQQQGYILQSYPVWFEDVKQVLFAFEITWMVGFVWCLVLAWPDSLRNYFLRRCRFDEADFVAVHVPDASFSSTQNDSSSSGKSVPFYIKNILKATTTLHGWLNSVLSTFFSDDTRKKEGGNYTYCPVEEDEQGNKSFYFRLRRYNYDDNESAEKFVPGVVHIGTTIGDLRSLRHGLSPEEVDQYLKAAGPNSIRLKKPNLLDSIYDEFGKLFYLYQNFLIWAWFPLWFFYIAILHTVVRVAGGLSVAYFKWKNDCCLYQLGQVTGDVDVLRDGQFISLPQQALVPGDIVAISSGLQYCDMVLLEAEHILVDESALTGEVTPIAKTALDAGESDKAYDPAMHKKHTISAGTTVIESDEQGKDLAVVTKTGSFTSKGELLRDILSYKRHRFKFDVEIEIVILILALYAVFCMIITLYFLEDEPVYGWFYGMYVVGTALPPLLPTVFVVSVGISDNRLLKKRIACTDSEGILVAGKVKVAFFDKTGTLTEQGLAFLSALSGSNWNKDIPSVPPSDELVRGMAVCHTLSKTVDGILVGNSVDITMFQQSGAKLEAYPDRPISVVESSGRSLTVLKRFDFDHRRMTQAVIVKDADGNILTYVKGSAESIKRICNPRSLPVEFDEIARRCARDGIYQIAMGVSDHLSSDVDIATISRDDAEANIDFVGFLNFKNVLKAETRQVLKELEEGDVRSAMITGDNVLTGINIAQECNLIPVGWRVLLGSSINSEGEIIWIDSATDEVAKAPTLDMLDGPASHVALAVTGETWSKLLETPEYAVQLSEHIRVYGRCTPNDKVSIVSTFVKKGNITLMCGDGGNDCGALKTAHVGIALSRAEASVVSPFTSLDLSLTAVTDILKEGRCALASAFSSYKYMIVYGQVETLSQVINAYFRITFADWNWTFMDGIWLISLAFALSLAEPAARLSPKRPTSSLLGPQTLSSVLGILFLNYFFTMLAIAALFGADWFSCRQWEFTDISNVLTIGDNYESEVIFLVTGYQYISSAIAFNFGYTYRAGWFRNYWFVFFALLWTTIHFIVTLVPSELSCLFRVNCSNEDVVTSVTSIDPQPINNPYNTTLMPADFRWVLILMMLLNLSANVCWDYFIVYGSVGEKIVVFIKKRISKKPAVTDDLRFSESTEKGFAPVIT